MEGISQPSEINEHLAGKIKGKRTGDHQEAAYYMNGIKVGNRTILSQAITLVESSLPAHQKVAQEIIGECLKIRNSLLATRHSYQSDLPKSTIEDPTARSEKREARSERRESSIRIGITGVPGVGKSTFIEVLGKHITSLGHKLAVLAVDPSSSRSSGSILGDKTRMEELGADPNAFIRPSPSAGSLGGVARKTRESVILCEAAGFDVIFIETVGVGQSETAVHSMVDFFLLMMLPGAGDELQGIKRGIIEMADAIIVHKADGDNMQKAKLAKSELENALHLYPPSDAGWKIPVTLCSSRTKDGITAVWDTICDYQSYTLSTNFFSKKRLEQERQLLYQSIEGELKRDFYSRNDIKAALSLLEEEINEGIITPYEAAQGVLKRYFDDKGDKVTR